MPIIEVDHVTKEFQLGQLTSLKQAALNTARRLTGRPVKERKPFKALDDISFSVEEGEVLGIIGHNGAGKSTLLKLLANISKPTRGSVRIHGKVAPLIEVGAGLVGDLTGRENIYLNGSILGISRAEINRKFDDIVAFAELEEFIDTPIKRYSSGMQVKLGFSIATTINSEILIVDEVLAVGDVSFQRKCLSRMESLINNQGRTVIVVGHNIRQLERICSRMLLMKHGRIDFDGNPGETTRQFLDESTFNNNEENNVASPSINTGDVDLISIEVISNTEPSSICRTFSDLRIIITLNVKHPILNGEMNIGIHNPEMVFVTKTNNKLGKIQIDLEPGIMTIEVIYQNIPLCPGAYGIGFSIFDWSHRPVWAGIRQLWFDIKPSSNVAAALPQSTLTYLPSKWNITPRDTKLSA